MALRHALAKSQGAFLPLHRPGSAKMCRAALHMPPRSPQAEVEKWRISVVSRVWHALCIGWSGPKWSSTRGATLPGLRVAPTAKNKKRSALVLRSVFFVCGVFLLEPQAPARAIRPAWPSYGGPALSGPPLRARGRACGPAGRKSAPIEGCADSGREATARPTGRRALWRGSQGGRMSAARRLRAQTKNEDAPPDGGAKTQAVFTPL